MAAHRPFNRRVRGLHQGRAGLSSYRYLTLDCYGTLIDWRAGIEAALKRSFREVPVGGKALLDAYLEAEKQEEASYKKYGDVLRNSALRLSRSLGFEASPSAADAFAASLPAWPAFPDTRKALRDLGRNGYRRYILSNVDTDLLQRTIANHGLEVEGFVTAEEVGSYKPDHGHWLTFFRKTGAEKEEVLHVAQSVYHDILPVQEMDIASAWVNRYGEPLPPNVKPEFIVESMESLAKLLG